MKWDEIRTQFPHQWLIVEAIKAHSDSGKRILDDLAVIEMVPNAEAVMQRYSELRREMPGRELLFLHTDRETLDIEERRWLGIRGGGLDIHPHRRG